MSGNADSAPAPRTVGRGAAAMGAATALSRGVGLARILVITAVLGATYLGDTFQASNSVSNVLFELLAAGALSAVLVPSFVMHVETKRDDELEHLVGGLLGYTILVLGAVSMVGVLCAPLIARVLTLGAPPGVAADQRELSTFLLRFFLPQVVLYGFGAVATALLYARRRFSIAAAAPIGNTVIVVIFMLLFRASAGPNPGLELSTVQRSLLAMAGTGGVIAFVGILVCAASRSGTRLRPRLMPHDAAVRGLLAHSGWGILLHSVVGLLLGVAIIVGNSVEGGVIAYQAAFVLFLAPYAIIAQPLHTAVMPELALAANRGDLDGYGITLRSAFDKIVMFTAPIAALLIATALPAMRAARFGQGPRGIGLLAAALAGLAVGLVSYSTFLLFARAMYSLGDSRTPALIAILSGLVGVVAVVAGAAATHGAARVAAIGLGHSAAYTIGAILLGRAVVRRSGRPLYTLKTLRPAVAAVLVGVPVWLLARQLPGTGRVDSALSVLLASVALVVAYLAVFRSLGGSVRLRRAAAS